MLDNEKILTLNLDLEPGMDPKNLAEDTDQLRDEIKKLNVRKIDLVTKKELDPNKKAIETIVLGSLIVKLAPTVLPSLVAVLKIWLDKKSNKGRKMRVSIGADSLEMEGGSSKEQEEALQEFYRRHHIDAINK